MYFKNSSVNRKICVLTIICALTVLPTYAEDTSKNIEVQKSVIEMRMDNLSTQYLDEVEKLFYKQRDLQEYDTALQTVNYLINASIKYNGENHPQTGFAYIARARYYTELMIPDHAKNDLDKANEIYEHNKDNYDLRNNIANTYMDYNMRIEQPYQAIKYMEPIINQETLPEFVYRQLGQINIRMNNIKEAEKYFAKYYDKIKEKANNEKELFYYHLEIAEMYQYAGKYNLYLEEINKAEKILETIDTNKEQLKILLNTSKIQYYIEMKEFDKAFLVLEENNELISKSGKEYQKQNIIQHYIDYFREQKDIKEFNKLANEIDKFYKTLPEESLLYLTLEEKQIDINKALNNFDQATEYANDALKRIEPYKDYTPYLYGKYLRKMAEIKIAEGKAIEAKIYLDKALESFKKGAPETAYEFYEIYKNYAEYSQMSENYNDAINYYNKAESVIKGLKGEKSNEYVDIYSGLANTYINSGKNKEAIKYSDNAVSIRENNYGKTHIKTIEEKLNQYNIYEAAGLQSEAIKILDEINTMFDKDEVIGTEKEIIFRLDIINAYISMAKEEYESAIINTKEALKNALTKRNKQEAYHLLYQIYSKTNNKLKAYKYKKLLEKIEKE